MTLMEIYDFIKFVGDKDYNGNYFRPAQFNAAIQAANLDLYKKVTGIPEEYQPGVPLAREHLEMNQKALDEVRDFKGHEFDQAVASGYFALPADFIYHDSCSYKYQRNVDGSPETLYRPVEILREDQAADRLGNWIKRPTTKHPIAVYRRIDASNNRLYLYPATINAVDFHYYRLPVQPVFDYTITNDELVYAPGSSTEFEWLETKHMDLVRILMSYLGVNLSHELLLQYAEQLKTQGV